MHYDLIVVGLGHAGCEAAAAAARMGLRVAGVTFRETDIARLSCNPAVGGLGKGHLVRELDALGGLMGRAADAACVQFRHLNTRKGLAVRSSRAQVDIHHYPRHIAAALGALPGLDLIEGEVTGLDLGDDGVAGVDLADGRRLRAAKVCLTTGTFLSAVMHCGDVQTVGGRRGDRASHALATTLRSAGVRTGRLKTGTVPRLHVDSIDWDRLAPQTDVVPGGRFSFGTPGPRLPQLVCRLTWTNERVHQLIRDGLHRSPLFTGRIEGVGPRYCPSIEDKVVRFPDRTRHRLHLEPEGIESDRVYVNGLSTSLPADLQHSVIHAIEGLERAVVLQHGYAVEYDYADPRDLGHDLQHAAIPGLYLAGQINGTSGYEEAAVQGFVAGTSAALGEPLGLGREEAYIAVLVDDLVTKGVGGEPYRMFTSRAEHRLLLREDNADRRLMPRGRSLGLIDDVTWDAFRQRQARMEDARHSLGRMFRPDRSTQAAFDRLGLARLRRPASVGEVLRRQDVMWSTLTAIDPTLPALDDELAQQLEQDVKYEGYVVRATKRAERSRRMEGVAIPRGQDWTALVALSNEVRQRLIEHQPTTLGQAARLPGITPSAVNLIATWLSRQAV